VQLTIDQVKVAAKREDFRAGVQMRMLMPRLSVRVTRWVVAHTRLRPNQITLVSLAVGLSGAFAFISPNPWVVLAGLLAYHLHVLLDYVDGEVARCRGETSVRGAYFDLVTDRITFPLLVFCAGVGAWRLTGQDATLLAGFAATFGLFLDKEACDCWYRANAGGGSGELEDRYVAAPVARTGWRLWRGRLSLLAVMLRGLTAFLTYTVVAAFLDATIGFPFAFPGAWRALVVWTFAPIMLLGALARFLLIFTRGAIPRRQELL
jgi:phosphatidylglycerophosphate synthase